MIDALFNQPTYLAAKKMLDATTLRHEAIANNIANLETPNFRRTDLAPSFSQQLQRALASKDPRQIGQLQPYLETDRTARPVRSDGNTVDMETELMRLNQNRLEHTLETQLITGRLNQLRLAITGRS